MRIFRKMVFLACFELAAISPLIAMDNSNDKQDEQPKSTFKIQKKIYLDDKNSYFASAIVSDSEAFVLFSKSNDISSIVYFPFYTNSKEFILTALDLVTLNDNECLLALGDNTGAVDVYLCNAKEGRFSCICSFSDNQHKALKKITIDLKAQAFFLVTEDEVNITLPFENKVLSLAQKNSTSDIPSAYWENN